jgi:hypothetical protein
MTLRAPASLLGLARIWRGPGRRRPHAANGWDSVVALLVGVVGSNGGSNRGLSAWEPYRLTVIVLLICGPGRLGWPRGAWSGQAIWPICGPRRCLSVAHTAPEPANRSPLRPGSTVVGAGLCPDFPRISRGSVCGRPASAGRTPAGQRDASRMNLNCPATRHFRNTGSLGEGCLPSGRTLPPWRAPASRVSRRCQPDA